jgi:type IV pilus assembly protein PilO
MKDTASFSVVQEKIAALTTLQKALVFVGTFLLLGIAFYFGVYKDHAETIRKLKSDIASQETRLATLKKAAAQVEVLQKELAESKEALNQLLALLPDQKEIPGLLENVSKLGAQVGLENILFEPLPEQPHEFYATIPIRLDLLGTYHELGTFFDSVSRLDRILKVENLNITRQKDTSRLQVNCTVVTYRFIEKPVQAGEGAAKKAGS